MTRPAFDGEHLATPIIVCSFLCAGFFGTSTTQTVLYFRSFKNDPLWLKLLLLTIWTLDAVHTGLIFHSLHYIFIRNFNNPSVFHSFPSKPLSFDIAFLMGAASMALVIAFHSYRVKLVTSSVLIRCMCFIVTGTRNVLFLFLAALSCTAIAKHITLSSGHGFLLEWTGTLTLACIALSAFGDVNGTLIVCFTLWRHRKEKFNSTKNLVTKIVIYTVRSGVCRTVFMCTILIWMIIAPIDVPWVVLVILGPRVYSASLLTTLNTRLSLRASSTMDSIGENLDYLDELGSMQFDESASRTDFDHAHKGMHQESDPEKTEQFRRKEWERPSRPTLSLSGSTPPMSPVVDPRDLKPFQHPYDVPLPGAELTAELERCSPSQEGPMRTNFDLEHEEILFTRQARYFTFNTVDPKRLSILSASAQQWADGGTGKALLLRDKQSNQTRFALLLDAGLADDETSATVAVTHPVTPSFLLHPTVSSTCSWIWKVPQGDGSHNPGYREEFLAVRFSSDKDAQEFHNASRELR
jgi:hypothetical protein